MLLKTIWINKNMLFISQKYRCGPYSFIDIMPIHFPIYVPKKFTIAIQPWSDNNISSVVENYAMTSHEMFVQSSTVLIISVI